MSTARGNLNKSGPPKHQNKSAFKNNLHDTSSRTKQINAIEVVGACVRCTEVIEWKIRYKKYKPLTVPKKCTECSQKCVKRAYYLLCDGCVEKTGRCGKCGKREEIMAKPGPSPAEAARQQAGRERDLKLLSERQRRTFFRLQAQGKPSSADPSLADDSLQKEDPSLADDSPQKEDPSLADNPSQKEDPPQEEDPPRKEDSSSADAARREGTSSPDHERGENHPEDSDDPGDSDSDT